MTAARWAQTKVVQNCVAADHDKGPAAVLAMHPELAHLPFISPLYLLGQASIEVFSVHVLCCLAGHALSEDADPIQPWWQQTILLIVTISALFLTALGHRTWVNKRRSPS